MLVSDAFVVVPGGIGSVLELMMVWQLLQVRKLHDTPLILAGKMYADLVDWCRSNMLRDDVPLASPGDMTIPVCVDDGPAIMRVIREHHAAWIGAQEQPREMAGPEHVTGWVALRLARNLKNGASRRCTRPSPRQAARLPLTASSFTTPLCSHSAFAPTLTAASAMAGVNLRAEASTMSTVPARPQATRRARQDRGLFGFTGITW